MSRTGPQRLRWELVRCTGCGHDYIHPCDRLTLRCQKCGGQSEVLPLQVVDESAPAFSIAEIRACLEWAVGVAAGIASSTNDQPRAEHYAGRAAAYRDVIEMLDAIQEPAEARDEQTTGAARQSVEDEVAQPEPAQPDSCAFCEVELLEATDDGLCGFCREEMDLETASSGGGGRGRA